MRNLKRALSLTLASVMLLGMMVVGSSAAAGYDDVDVNDNVEAIEVLQAVKVMVGDDRGFGPDRPVTRNEMAVVMGKLLNLDYNYYSASCPFTDVADWAKGWVGAAAANGIVSGRGNGIYDGEATVTAVEAASMMMRALGYFKYQNDYADGFQVATVRQGTKIGIFDQVGTDATTAMTRNQVAQMALNALQTGMVEPDGNTINLTTPDGSVFTGKVNYVNVTSKKDFAHAISWTEATSAGSTNTGYIVELGEQLYDGKLKLEDGKLDDFGRPSRYWEYDGKAIGTYMKKELIKQEYTNEVKGKDLYDLLGSDTIKNYDLEITIDGVNVVDEKDVMNDAAKAASYFDKKDMVKTNKAKVGQTGKGVLTQVFVDPDWHEVGKVWISVINTYLAKATNDYNDKKDEIKLDVYGLDKDGSVYYKYHHKDDGFAAKHDGKDSEDLPAAGEDFSKVIDMKKDDIVLVTVANGEIKSVSDPQVLAAVELSEFSKDNYVVSDSKYEYNTTIDYDPEVLDDYTGVSATQQLKDTEYNLFLDPYGYLIGVEVVEAVKNYIFLTGIDQGNSNLNAKVSDAAGILTDGTFVNFKMNMKDSKTWTDGGTDTVNPAGATADNGATMTAGKFQGHALWNTWCTYTVDKDGTYTLTEVGNFDDTQKDTKPAKAGQYADLAVPGDGTTKGKEIGTKRVSLMGQKNGVNGGSRDAYVYGNDNSVYILAEVKEVNSKNKIYAGFPIADGATVTRQKPENTPVIVISGVDSVGTGIDNVKIETLINSGEIQNAADSNAAVYPGYIYTLFDKDGYVIAAVILGEDSGTTKNLVYSHKDSVESEKYNKDSDDWTWTRKVISNGEETLLTQTGDKVDPKNSIYRMDENTWYEVTYKADGTVKSVRYAYFTESGKKIGNTVALNTDPDMTGPALKESYVATNAEGEFVNHIEFLEKTVNGAKSTVLYEEVWGAVTTRNEADTTDVVNKVGGSTHGDGAAKTAMLDTNAPSLKGSTLYVDTKASKGFYVHEDVKSVLIQKNNGEKTTSYGSGTSDLEGFLRTLNYAGGTYLFKISAILVDGRATVVVIHDWNEGTNAPDTYSVTFSGDTGNVTIDPATLTGIEKGDSVSFTVKPKRGYVLDSVKIGARTLTPVDGVYTIANVTGDITVTIETSADPNVMSDAIAVLKADGSEFKVFYEDAAGDDANKPAGTALANLLIEAAEDAGYTGVKAKLDASGKWVITGTDKSGRIELSAAAYDPTAVIASYVGTVDTNTKVYVDKTVKLNAVDTWGKSTLPVDYLDGKGTLGKFTNMSSGTAIDTDYYALNDSNAVFADGFTLETGYVKVSGTDLTANNKAIPMDEDYTVPKAPDFGTAGKGTGMTYQIGGTTKYITYSPASGTAVKIPASEIKGDITLTKDYITVTVAFKSGITGWTKDATTTAYVKVAATQAVSIVLKNAANALTTATVADTKYEVSGGVTVAEKAFDSASLTDSNHTYTLGITDVGVSAATGDITITINDLGLSA